jgi:quercetin dioxygenase-like cupin family protein
VRLGALGPCRTPVFNRWRRHSEEKETNVSKLESARAETCTIYHLPGRDWYYLLGPLNSGAKNLTFGLAEFPGGTLAAPHAHAAEEEIIYILSGAGATIAGDQEIALEPGVAVFIPPGLTHQIRVDGAEPLRLVTLFSPPVTPGAYDPEKS